MNPQGGINLGGFHLEILKPLFDQIFLISSFHLWPGIFILFLIVFWKKIFVFPNYYLFLVILGAIAVYFCLYLFTTHYEYVIDGTSVGRNFLTLMPISVFLAGILLKDTDKSL